MKKLPRIDVYTPDTVPFRETPSKRPKSYMTDVSAAVDAVAEGGIIYMHAGEHVFDRAGLRASPKSFTLRAVPGDEWYVKLRAKSERCFDFAPWGEPRVSTSDRAPPRDGPAANSSYATVTLQGVKIIAGATGNEGACIRANNVNVILNSVSIEVTSPDGAAVDLQSGFHHLESVQLVGPARRSRTGVIVGGRSDLTIDGRSEISGFNVGVQVVGRVLLRKLVLFENNGRAIHLTGGVSTDATRPLVYRSEIEGSRFAVGAGDVGVDVADDYGGELVITASSFEPPLTGSGGVGLRVPRSSRATVRVGAPDVPSSSPTFTELSTGIDAAGSVSIEGAEFYDNATALRLELSSDTSTTISGARFRSLGGPLIRFGAIGGGELFVSDNRMEPNARAPK
ncbi:MAG: hypothetical protein K2Q06_11060, partial [Parvularculaceae bacterium]|nr:hypothetical protein [Parvularculaceae bacterium]